MAQSIAEGCKCNDSAPGANAGNANRCFASLVEKKLKTLCNCSNCNFVIRKLYADDPSFQFDDVIQYMKTHCHKVDDNVLSAIHFWLINTRHVGYSDYMREEINHRNRVNSLCLKAGIETLHDLGKSTNDLTLSFFVFNCREQMGIPYGRSREIMRYRSDIFNPSMLMYYSGERKMLPYPRGYEYICCVVDRMHTRMGQKCDYNTINKNINDQSVVLCPHYNWTRVRQMVSQVCSDYYEDDV